METASEGLQGARRLATGSWYGIPYHGREGVKVAVQVTFQGSGGGSGRRCCARQQLRARESFTRWCHPASPRPGDSSTSRQEGSPPYSIQPDCWCSVACAMLLLEVVDRGAEVEVVLPVPTTVLWRRF